jgi:4-hydroxy-4-methyl-2-oxoglutarate aldolase
MPAAAPSEPKVGEAARARAFAAIRQAILSGELAPGRRLVEEDLAASLGVTRQSLRAALLDLTADGLVERIPNRGARVRVVTTEEAVAITECRMALEALCAVKAALRISDADAAGLRQLGENLKRAVADGNSLRYSELNRELHRRIGAISEQHVAIGLLDRLHAQLVRHQFQLALRPGRPEVSLAEHLAILEAVADRRPNDANLAVRAHLASVIEALLAAPAEPVMLLSPTQRIPRTMLNVIVTDPPRADLPEVDKLAEYGVATVHEAIGRRGYLGPTIRPNQQGARVSGTALTVICWPGDNLMIHAAVEQARPGDIIVVTTASPSTDGAFGELLATSLAARGVRGLIMGAGLRDTRELREMGFPAWTAHVSAQGTVKETPGSVNVPVTLGGQTIRPGDAIVADDDGVCVVPRLDVATAVTASVARIAKEDANRADLAAGVLGLDLYNLRPKLAEVEHISYAEYARRAGEGV